MSEENLPKDVTYLTREGMRKLETELAHLRTDGRAEVAQRLHQALEEGGDLLENAEFEAAKNEQAFVEGRIMTIETMLLHAKIIKKSSTATGIIGLGSVVVIKEEGGKAETYKIVGAVEANPAEGSSRTAKHIWLGAATLPYVEPTSTSSHAYNWAIQNSRYI